MLAVENVGTDFKGRAMMPRWAFDLNQTPARTAANTESTAIEFLIFMASPPCAFWTLLFHGHERGACGHPLAVEIHEHSQYGCLVPYRDLAAVVSDLENRTIRGQRHVSIDCHQLEVLRVGAGISRGNWAGRGCRGLSLDHFLLVCNFTLHAYFEESVGPNLILEVHAILRVVLVIFVRANPLVVNVRQLLFQICPTLSSFFHGVLREGQRR